MHITTALFAVFNERQLLTVLCWRVYVNGRGRGERNFSGFWGIQCSMFIKLNNRCAWPLIHMSYNPFSVPNRIHNCYHKLTLVWSLNIVSCIIIRVAVSFALYNFQIWQIQNSVFNWTWIKHSNCSLFRITHALVVIYVGIVIQSFINLQCKIVVRESWLTVHHRGSSVPSLQILMLRSLFADKQGYAWTDCGFDSASHSIPVYSTLIT